MNFAKSFDWVTQVSLFEIAIKQKIGKLPELNISTENLIIRLLAGNFNILPIKNTHVIAYHDIPLVNDHEDPIDCLILATTFSEICQLFLLMKISDCIFLRFS